MILVSNHVKNKIKLLDFVVIRINIAWTKSDYIFPSEFIDKMYALDYVKYIYSKKEIINFKDSWFTYEF